MKKENLRLAGKTFETAIYFCGGLAAFFLFVFCVFTAFNLHGAFVGQWHNVDLSLNAANQECGGCLASISDHGFNAVTGQHVNVTLEDSYVESSYNLRKYYRYTTMFGFLAGVLLMCGLILVTSGAEKGVELEEAYKKVR